MESSYLLATSTEYELSGTQQELHQLRNTTFLMDCIRVSLARTTFGSRPPPYPTVDSAEEMHPNEDRGYGNFSSWTTCNPWTTASRPFLICCTQSTNHHTRKRKEPPPKSKSQSNLKYKASPYVLGHRSTKWWWTLWSYSRLELSHSQLKISHSRLFPTLQLKWFVKSIVLQMPLKSCALAWQPRTR